MIGKNLHLENLLLQFSILLGSLIFKPYMNVNETVLTDVGMVQQLQVTDKNIEAERKRPVCRFSHKPVHGRSCCYTQTRAQA